MRLDCVKPWCMEACIISRKQMRWQPRFLRGQRCRFWAQTLCDIAWTESMMGAEQRQEPQVLAAQTEGVMCPALIELVCEVLESSGAEPERLMACRVSPL